jgi:uncharacterized damage-inducible protein DinB
MAPFILGPFSFRENGAECLAMEIEQRHVEPVAGFSPGIGYYLASFQFGREQTKELLQDLTNEEIARRFSSGMHSIGAIGLHLGECEYWYFQTIAMEKEMTDEGKKLCHFCDTMETDHDKGLSAEYLINTLDTISEMNREFLAGLKDEALDKFHPRNDVEPARELSLRWMFQLLIDHEAHHRGQISMIKRLIRGGETAS